MNNLFQFLSYIFGGKAWIKWDMVQGLKMAIFVNEMEIAMFKKTYNDAVAKKESLEADLQALVETPLANALELLPEDKKESGKALHDMKRTIEEERKEQTAQFRAKIKEATQEVEMADGELSRVYSIAYSNRRKYDFVRNYKVKATYADKNK